MSNFKRILAAFLVVFAATAAIPVQANAQAKALSQAVSVKPIDINRASAEEIAARITGIGIKRAQAIVDYRNTYGPFESIEDLLDVKGVGKATIEKNRNRFTL